MHSSRAVGEISEDGAAGVNEEAVSPFTVMIIDDSKTIRCMAEALLAEEGYQVITATDGFEALSIIVDQRPDLIFLDIMMPRLDGYQTCALIKNHMVYRHIPVVMLSSHDGLFDRARGRVVGSDHYITKPFTREKLLQAIELHAGGNVKHNEG